MIGAVLLRMAAADGDGDHLVGLQPDLVGLLMVAFVTLAPNGIVGLVRNLPGDAA